MRTSGIRKGHSMRALIIIAAALILAGSLAGQQVADTAFKPHIDAPAFSAGGGPVMMIDEAHYNFHTAGGRYSPFAELLRQDGYTVSASATPFVIDSLRRGSILVVANALNERNTEDWSLPTPSAFTENEIGIVRQWVFEGGSLFLIADHMPFGGAAERLAAAFGFEFSNGFAMPQGERQTIGDKFRRTDSTLFEHAITQGRSDIERIDSVVSFTGQAFRGDSAAAGIMVFGADVVSMMPQEAWEFTDSTPRIPVTGWFQLAAKEFGKGRVVVAGEAAMFTAQLAGEARLPVGMNSPEAAQNPQLLLNIMHWLSRIL